MMACALTLGFASCSNDDEVDNGGIIPNGEPTVALIKLSQVAGPTTRADIKEAVGNEKKVTKAIVYIFGATGKFEQAVELNTSEASAGKVVAITTGSHYFYAAVNPIAGVPSTFAEDTPLETVKKDVLTSLTLAKLTEGTDGFFMTNVSDASAQNIVAGKADGTSNLIDINVGRAVAKVNVALADDVENGTSVFGEGNKFTDMEYKMGGNPNQMYLFPVYESGVLKTPLYSTTYAAANYFADAAYRAGDTPGYIVENANAKTIKQGEATHAVVKGVFTPDGMTEGADFWRVYNASTETWETTIYDTEAAAKSAANYPTDKATKKIVKYEGGVCHYAFWVIDENAADKYTINRNSYYNIKIESVAKIGTNEEGGDKDIDGDPIVPSNPPVKPEEPIEADTHLKVSIKVLDWTVVNTGVGL
ncbi:Mfa1 family fimbria major subunit, partial [Bacteroides sp. 51]|uniref:Mfa1 family fimbria major subunit n=1 Tax=Bacteroides sp. 51 TaxID=2302938 RepID=UPI0019402EEF